MRALLLLCLMLMPALCSAWGWKGHQVVAEIGFANLSPATQAKVSALLIGDLAADGTLSGRTSLAAVSSWADEIRGMAQHEKTKAWHFRKNSVCSADSGKCEDGACIDAKLRVGRDSCKNTQILV
jgi:hypothetical protein